MPCVHRVALVVFAASVVAPEALRKVSRHLLAKRMTSSWEESYSDKGTGANRDLAVWRPRVNQNEYRVAYTATNSYGGANRQTYIVSGEDGKALAKPRSFVCLYNDRGTGGDRDGSFWRPIAPEGYVCLSDVAIYRGNGNSGIGYQATPDEIDAQFRCIHSSLVEETQLGGGIWTDSGSGGTYDGGIWGIQGSDGMRVSNDARGRPPPDQRQSKLKLSTGNNDNDGDGLDDDFEMQCAQRFKPVMYLHSDEQYGPGKVEDYLRSCVLRRQHSCADWASLAEVAEGAEKAEEGGNASRAMCPHQTAVATRLAPCWWSDRDTTIGQATSELLGQYGSDGGNGILYLRCLGCNGRNCNNMGKDQPGAGGVTSEDGLRQTPFYVHVMPDNRFGRPMIHIQYWFWYPFNGPTIGFGTHQGDWENFAMLVDDTCTTRLKYMTSAHGNRNWNDEGTGDVEFENGALVHYSAVNSHAGFMTEGEHDGGTIITKDYTNKGPRWYPDELVNIGETSCSGGGLKPMSNATAFVDFVGWWGTASAFDGVLEGIPSIGSICPGGPTWSFNKETPFGCRSR